MKQAIELPKTRCPNCGSLLIHIRIKTRELVCRYCGYIGKLDNQLQGGNKT